MSQQMRHNNYQNRLNPNQQYAMDIFDNANKEQSTCLPLILYIIIFISLRIIIWWFYTLYLLIPGAQQIHMKTILSDLFYNILIMFALYKLCESNNTTIAWCIVCCPCLLSLSCALTMKT